MKKTIEWVFIFLIIFIKFTMCKEVIATVTGVEGDLITIDKGVKDEVTIGSSGEVYYEIVVYQGEEKFTQKVLVAKAIVKEVKENESTLSVTEKKGIINKGYLAKLIISAVPTEASEALSCGKDALAQGNLDMAEQNIRTALSLDPKLSEAEYYLAVVLEQKGKYDEAIKELENFVKNNYTDPKGYKKLALIYEEKGELNKAVTYWKYALSCYPEYNYIFDVLVKATDRSIKLLEEALTQEEDISLHVRLVLMYEQKGNFQSAIKHYKKIFSLLPYPPPQTPYTSKPVEPDFFELGSQALAENKLARAITYLELALDKDPNKVEAYYYLGRAYLKLGSLDEAFNSFKQFINYSKDPLALRDAYMGMGQILEQRNDYQGALVRYKLALSYIPEYSSLLNTQVEATDKAKVELEKYLAKNPSDNNARVKLILIYEQKGEFQKGVEQLKNLLY